MIFEQCEILRTLKRIFDGYFSSKKAFLFVVIGMGLLLYLGPGIFHWLREKAPHIMDVNAECLEAHLSAFREEQLNFDVSISKSYGREQKTFLPYVGNGHIGLAVNENKLFLFHKRSLSLLLNYGPVVHVDTSNANKQEATVLHLTHGIVYKYQCFSWKEITASVSHQFFTDRYMPSLLVQQIQITNPSNQDVSISLNKAAVSPNVQLEQLRLGGENGGQYNALTSYVKIPDTSNVISYAIATDAVPSSVIIHAKSSRLISVRTVIHYSSPTHFSEHDDMAKRLKNRSYEDFSKVVDMSVYDIKKRQVDIWKMIWHSGFSISFSRAQRALNGDKINATLYYVLSNMREYMSEGEATPLLRQSLQKYLIAPDKCYGGHHTLQASTLWSDLNTISDVNSVVSLWLLTLNKQGCHNIMLAGASGVMQAMILSFGGFKFSNDHLEFDTEPKDLHRDYHFRRIVYGNLTHINVSVIVQEDNKAVIYTALDRSDKSYFACDAGCLDPPIKLGSVPEPLPVKITSPLTAILYITADKQHMEELKHTIHVKEVIEAPAHEHHIIALHRHGHQLGGLPAFFWISIAFLIAVFHLFLIKLIYNEYCGNAEKSRKRYLV